MPTTVDVEPETVQLLDGHLEVQVYPSNNGNTQLANGQMTEMNTKNGHHLTKSTGTSTDYIELIWRNLTYTVIERTTEWNNLKPVTRSRPLHLIKNLNGQFESGKLTAIVGPSGAGKTTMIECLAGRRRNGVSGQIVVNRFGAGKVKIAYNGQQESMVSVLTVRETLTFASKVKNQPDDGQGFNNQWTNDTQTFDGNFNLVTPGDRDYHRSTVNNLLQSLGLSQCAEVKVSSCSGGQLKRLSIALELISSPSILLLDEPTSGLDSVSCLQVIELLRNLASSNRPMVIAASIHQPTAKMLSYFDHLYVMSLTGQCVYDGKPDQLVARLADFGLLCPQYHNPADFITEIATGDRGPEIIKTLADSVTQQSGDMLTDHHKLTGGVKISKIVRQSRNQNSKDQLSLFTTLLLRSLVMSYREPIMSWLRFLATIVVLMIIAALYVEKRVGDDNGCVDQFDFDAVKWFGSNPDEMFNQNSKVADNLGWIFFSVFFIGVCASIPVCFTFPMEMPVLTRELANGWYSVGSYYLAKIVAETPFMVVYPVMYGLATYYMTAQYDDSWRLMMFISCLVLLSFCCQSFGFLISSFYSNQIVGACFMTTICNVPMFLFAGIFVRVHTMLSAIQPLTFLSYYRLAFESILITIYGFGRCPDPVPVTIKMIKEKVGDDLIPVMNCLDEHDPTILMNATRVMNDYNEEMKKQTGSMVMQGFDVRDDDLWVLLGLLAFYTVTLQIASYLVLKYKFERKK